MDGEHGNQTAISVVIPAFNVENCIERTLQSIVNQTLQAIEVVIVNDGSTDDTLQVIDRVLSESPIQWKVITQVNAGVSAARNTGIHASNGEYVLFLDGDDYIDLECLQLLYSTAIESDSDIVFCGFNDVDETGNRIRTYSSLFSYLSGVELGTRAMMMMLTRIIWIWTGSAIYRRDFLNQYGLQYTVGCKMGEDQEFILKALFHGSRITCVPQTLSYYVQRRESVTKKPKDYETVMGPVQAFARLADYLVLHNAEPDTVEFVQSFIMPYMLSNAISSLAEEGLLSKEQLYEIAMSKEALNILGCFRYPRSLVGVKGIRPWAKIKCLRSWPSLFIRLYCLRGQLRY